MFAGIFTDVVQWLDDVSSNWWFLGIIFVIAVLDSVIPIVPSETCVIIGGIAAGQGYYPLVFVIAAAALGAFIGDNTAYILGRRAGPWFERRAARKEKTAARLAGAKEQIRIRGGMLLVTARFIPGGRTVLTLSCGITRQPRGWFVGWIAIAALVWATFASLLGFIGGATFKDDHTAAFAVAFSTAITITVTIEVVRHLLHRRAEKAEASAP
jgi:membrane-associated protein